MEYVGDPFRLQIAAEGISFMLKKQWLFQEKPKNLMENTEKLHHNNKQD